MSSHKPSFIVDGMLGNLARKMRLLGYDSRYESSAEDSDLIKMAEKQRRIIISKDENLSKSAEKIGLVTVLIRGNDEVEQIIQIATKLGLSNFMIDSNSSRCVDCNGKLETIDKIRVMNKVPSGIYERQEKFWICRDCKKIYWEGTHFEKLQEFVDKLNQRLK
ncbi:MAG TPA: Mut7-C RNAse domain-containing protein [Candidatus Nitrosotalea sp.]|nr:Mut7-C RNAse domain-containing protein [Candidatus Nitrosotalea sp.]